jgi:hypothetical protein
MRARLPQSYPLAASEIKALGPNGGIHLVTLREEQGFVPRAEVRPLPDQARSAVGAVTVQRNAAGVHLHYRYTPMTGAPDRSHRPPIEFDVAFGQRARVAYNGRFSGYSIEWLYKLTVITLAVGIPLSPDLFTVAPDHAVEDLAELF